MGVKYLKFCRSYSQYKIFRIINKNKESPCMVFLSGIKNILYLLENYLYNIDSIKHISLQFVIFWQSNCYKKIIVSTLCRHDTLLTLVFLHCKESYVFFTPTGRRLLRILRTKQVPNIIQCWAHHQGIFYTPSFSTPCTPSHTPSSGVRDCNISREYG